MIIPASSRAAAGTSPVGAGPVAIGRPVVPWAVWLPTVLGLAYAAVLIWAPYPGNLLLVAAGIIGVVAVASPPYALAALLLSIALNDVGEVTLGAVHFNLAKALVIGALIGWTLRALAMQRGRVRSTPIALAYAGYVAVLAASIVAAENIGAWADELYTWGVGGLVLLMAVDGIRTTKDARPVIAAIALGTIAVSLYAFYQVQANEGPPSFRVGGVIRAYGTFGQPNAFAKYLELSVPLLTAVAGAWAVERLPFGSGIRPFGMSALLSSPLALLSGIGAGTGLLALVLTQSRGGWIGGALALVVVAWLLGGAFRWATLVAGLVLALALILTPLGERAALRLGPEALGFSGWSQPVQVTTANWGVQERLAHWGAGITMTLENPILGVGAGNFDEHFRETTPNWRFRIPQGHAHNAYIHVAAQTGLVGLVMYLGLVGAVAARLAVRWRRSAPDARPLIIGAIGVSVAVAGHNMFDYLHVNTFPIQLSVIWALAEVAMSPRNAPQPESYGMVTA